MQEDRIMIINTGSVMILQIQNEQVTKTSNKLSNKEFKKQ